MFSKLDLSEALPSGCEECLKYLTMNMHKGIFRLSHLPFGLKVAPSLFQQIMDTMLTDMEYAIAYLDDILIKSENEDQHKTHILAVFQRIEEYGFKLSAEKCRFFMKKIKYLEQIINSDRRKPDPERAEAIKNMPAPDNVAILVLVNYYSIYNLKMYDMKAPLNNLVKKGAKWIWSKELEHTFKRIKCYLLADLSLAHFNLKRKIIVASDACDYGEGVVLLHKFEDRPMKPIIHALRMLLIAEQSYSQIEKESLAII